MLDSILSTLLKKQSSDIWVQFSSVAQSCLTLCDPMNRSTPGLPVHHQLPEFTQTHIHPVSDAIQPVMPSSHLILCHPLILMSPIPPRIKVFSNELTLCMRWPKYWSFSFSIIPSKEHPGLYIQSKQAEKKRRRIQGRFRRPCMLSCSVLTLCDPVDCSLPGSSVHGIFRRPAETNY